MPLNKQRIRAFFWLLSKIQPRWGNNSYACKKPKPEQPGVATPAQPLDWSALLAQHGAGWRTVVYACLAAEKG